MQSDLKYDSLSRAYSSDSSYVTTLYFYKGHLFRRTRDANTWHLQVYYSKDGDFELREEICDNGKIGFEGIFYKGKAYGLSTWWYCNGKKELVGVRYANEKIGVWYKWDGDDTPVVIDYHTSYPPNGMPQIQRN